jgi:hypothetical protein
VKAVEIVLEAVEGIVAKDPPIVNEIEVIPPHLKQLLGSAVLNV